MNWWWCCFNNWHRIRIAASSGLVSPTWTPEIGSGSIPHSTFFFLVGLSSPIEARKFPCHRMGTKMENPCLPQTPSSPEDAAASRGVCGLCRTPSRRPSSTVARYANLAEFKAAARARLAQRLTLSQLLLHRPGRFRTLPRRASISPEPMGQEAMIPYGSVVTQQKEEIKVRSYTVGLGGIGRGRRCTIQYVD